MRFTIISIVVKDRINSSKENTMVSMSEIQAAADSIVKEFGPERIILFGSYARGNPSSISDVDMMVVLSFEGKSFWKSLEILNRIDPQFSLDLFARRPDDATRRYEEGDPLIRDAIDHGKVLYERGD